MISFITDIRENSPKLSSAKRPEPMGGPTESGSVDVPSISIENDGLCSDSASDLVSKGLDIIERGESSIDYKSVLPVHERQMQPPKAKQSSLPKKYGPGTVFSELVKLPSVSDTPSYPPESPKEESEEKKEEVDVLSKPQIVPTKAFENYKDRSSVSTNSTGDSKSICQKYSEDSLAKDIKLVKETPTEVIIKEKPLPPAAQHSEELTVNYAQSDLQIEIQKIIQKTRQDLALYESPNPAEKQKAVEMQALNGERIAHHDSLVVPPPDDFADPTVSETCQQKSLPNLSIVSRPKSPPSQSRNLSNGSIDINSTAELELKKVRVSGSRNASMLSSPPRSPPSRRKNESQPEMSQFLSSVPKSAEVSQNCVDSHPQHSKVRKIS